MRVLIAGATGALGVPLYHLLSQGHQVIGLSRSVARQDQIQRLGAEAVAADALDPPRLRAAVAASAPDAVIHALTAISKRGPLRPADLTRTNVLRHVGTCNLLEAAIAAGARRFIAESMIFIYGYGDLGSAPLTEAQPLAQAVPRPWLRASLQALVSEEEQVIGASQSGQIEGVLLRFGGFYGPTAGAETLVRLLKRRLLPLPPGASGLACWIHAEDAAAAVVAALSRGRAGEAYNVVDDEPVPFADFLRELARMVDAPTPPSVPRWLVRWLAPFLAESWMGTGASPSVILPRRSRDNGRRRAGVSRPETHRSWRCQPTLAHGEHRTQSRFLTASAQGLASGVPHILRVGASFQCHFLAFCAHSVTARRFSGNSPPGSCTIGISGRRTTVYLWE